MNLKIRLLAIVCIFASIILSSCSKTQTDYKNAEENSDTVKTIETSQIENETVEDFLSDNILGKYSTETNNLELKYRVKNQEVYFDCSDFENTFLGHISGDLNNDGFDDIIIFTLEKHNINFEEDGEDNLILFHKRPFLFSNGKYVAAPDWSNKIFTPYLSISSNIEIKNTYTFNDANSKSFLVHSNTIYDDSSVYSEEFPPYYSPENSLGQFNSIINVQDYDKEGGFITKLSFQEIVDHISGMPEAENISYTDNVSGESLYSKGVFEVITGSDMSEPEFKSEDTDTFSDEQDAINVINQKLKKFDLNKYCISPFSWDHKEENSLKLNENNENTFTIKLIGKNIDDSNRICYIEIK